MGQIIKRAFDVSDGLASIANKRIKSLISELEKEGVMTKAESQAANKRLTQAKSNIYDAMSKELKKVLLQANSKSKRKAKSKPSRRKK